MTTTTWPASEKQTAFITTLLGQRQIALGVGVQIETLLAEGTMTSKEASAYITLLLAAPKKPQVVGTEVGTGYYLHEGQPVVVVESKTGNLYAKVLVLGGPKARWDYAPGLVTKLTGAPATLEIAKQWGHAHGYCFACGAQLTDPVSVEAGIGPVCAKKFA